MIVSLYYADIEHTTPNGASVDYQPNCYQMKAYLPQPTCAMLTPTLDQLDR